MPSSASKKKKLLPQYLHQRNKSQYHWLCVRLHLVSKNPFRPSTSAFHLLCAEILRPLPRSLRFPYTTLFRSKRSSGPLIQPLCLEAGSCGSALPAHGRPRCCSSSSVRRQDRKSTRLNSSHLGISYAVFCFKKKKTTSSVPTSKK